jgi:hypothetical protein
MVHDYVAYLADLTAYADQDHLGGKEQPTDENQVPIQLAGQSYMSVRKALSGSVKRIPQVCKDNSGGKKEVEKLIPVLDIRRNMPEWIWCCSHKHHHFCITVIGRAVLPVCLIPLVKMLYLVT